jgi:hypothetical protein
MKRHAFRPYIDLLDRRDTPGTSWGLPWVWGIAAFLVPHHLFRLPQIRPNELTVVTTQSTPKAKATVLSLSAPTSGPIATAGPVVSPTGSSISLDGPAQSARNFRGHRTHVTIHYGPLRWESYVRKLDSGPVYATSSISLAQAPSH